MGRSGSFRVRVGAKTSPAVNTFPCEVYGKSWPSIYECTMDPERVCATVVTAGCFNSCVHYALPIAACLFLYVYGAVTGNKYKKTAVYPSVNGIMY